MNIQLKDFFKNLGVQSTLQQQRYTPDFIQSTLEAHQSSFLLIFQMKQLIIKRLTMVKQNGIETINLSNLHELEKNTPSQSSLGDAITDLKMCLENIQSHLKTIHRTGAIIEDLDEGKLKWKSMLEDEPIELFWSFGSDRITHWQKENIGAERMCFSSFPALSDS